MILMHNYFERQKYQPQIGDYDPNFIQQDRRINVPNFRKYHIKDLMDPIQKPDGEVDGDNLILNPDKLKKKLPDINMKKQSGRPEDDLEERKDNDLQKELILDPNLNAIKPKIKGNVDISK